MLKVVLLISCVFSISFAQVPEHGQCGGQGYVGPTNCAAGLNCYAQNDYYSQCLTSCPTSGWMCSGSGGSSTQATTTTAGSGTTASTGAPQTGGKWPYCTFRFGAGYNGNADYSHVDHIVIWAGSPSPQFGNEFNIYWHGPMIDDAIKYQKIPVYVAYIIAFKARNDWGLQDCDVGSPSLCERGAEYIRTKRADIVDAYKRYAAATAARGGKNMEIVWQIEPDWWQYYGDTHHQGGPLSGTYMRQLFDDLVSAIKSELPNARIAWDISAWIGQAGFRTWWGFFSSHPDIDYLFTSGGQATPDKDEFKPGELAYSFMSTLTGKGIIADTGYGIAGVGQGHSEAWDNVTNLRNRISNGIIAITQANAKGNWGSSLSTIRPQMPKLC